MYAEHVALRRRRADAILAELELDAMVVAAGAPLRYHGDDQHAPFRRNAHFAHWLPLEGSGHLLDVRPGETPHLVRVVPRDFWHWHEPVEPGAEWVAHFRVTEVSDPELAWHALPRSARTAYVGDQPEQAAAHGIGADMLNPPSLLARMDWDRAAKSDWEVACMEAAQARAALGHHAARAAFEAGGSELEIHHAYVQAAACADADLPYQSIVALDEHAATLHYTPKQTRREGRVLLIDSGAADSGYAADITRTWTRAGCDPLFEELRIALDAVQRSLCEQVAPGLPFGELHAAAHRRIGDLLHALGLIRRGGDAAVASGLTAPFFPHGLGHLLGLQVHDVGGRQRDPAGGEVPPPPAWPALRTTRVLEPGHVVTIEPGVYFIDMLLAPLRDGPLAAEVDWGLVERLAPFGGVRIEDDVLVTAGGCRNLTRPHV